jgi:hypothetical protein
VAGGLVCFFPISDCLGAHNGDEGVQPARFTARTGGPGGPLPVAKNLLYGYVTARKG